MTSWKRAMGKAWNLTKVQAQVVWMTVRFRVWKKVAVAQDRTKTVQVRA
jgi:hypothetical protein